MQWVSLDGKIVPYESATVHIAAAALKYAASVFEGVRGYWNGDSGVLRLFVLDEHLRRLSDSAALMRMDYGHRPDCLVSSIEELILENDLRQDCYLRIAISIIGRGGIETCGPVSVSIDAFPFERKPGASGIHVSVSSWQRITDASMPSRLKCIANYHNGRLAKLQAKLDGYDDTLLLNRNGTLSEAPTSCFFLVKSGRLVTPSLSDDVLASITRQVVCELAGEMNLAVEEREITRSEAYLGDEAFLCGTGAEILPVLSIDRMPLNGGGVGPVTHRISSAYFDAARGRNPAYGARACCVRFSCAEEAP
jgi:branched-chain amino acid aminotransferase